MIQCFHNIIIEHTTLTVITKASPGAKKSIPYHAESHTHATYDEAGM